MLPRADIITVSPVGRAEALTPLEGVGDARQEAFQRSLAGLLGKSLQGEVLSKLTDGSFIVRVAGASARMLLPPGAQVGNQLPLTLVAVSPRPTFEIGGRPGGQAATAYSEAGPALLPGPAGAAARAAPLVYLEGGNVPAAPAAAAHPAAPGAAAAGLPLPAGAGAAAETAPPAQPAVQPSVQLTPQQAAQAAADLAARPNALAAALLNKAPLTPAEQLPALDPKSTPASFSEAAKVISSVLTTALKTDNPPTAIIARSPLVNSPAVQPEHLAAALKDAIGKSGLFYESHVADWANGQRGLGELVQEPQMQRALNAHAPEAALRQQAPATDPATAQFINLQLSANEQARVAWQGPVWPGQQMQWEIERDAPEQHGSEGEPAEPGWRSGLRLRFPLLGEIDATVALVGGQLQIRVQAGSGEVGALLRGHAAQLTAALEAAGTPLRSLDIGAGTGAGHG